MNAEGLDRIPAEPGVYLLRDRKRKVLYVGKARNLRSRVRAYFRGGDERAQIRFLVDRVDDVETLVTRNEKEALILENNLIKQYRPRYNIRLKDDKSYVSVKATVGDEWPKLVVTRKIHKDGSRYFGPFHSAAATRESLDAIRKVFPLRNCSDTVFRNRSRPCLEHQIRRCPGPCCLPVDPDEYRENLRNAFLVLEGKNDRLMRDLEGRMERASAELRFEEAGRLRDQIRALQKTAEPQEAVSHFGVDQDVFGFYREGGLIEVQVLTVRRGKLTGNLSYSLDHQEFPDEDVLGEILGRFYSGGRFLPDEVLLPVDLEDAAVRGVYLSELRGRRVHVFRPKRGDKRRLVEMATDNARQNYQAKRDTEETRDRMAAELQHRLGLSNAPKRIECFDISHLQGGETVGSMVTFDEGVPERSRYRRYRVLGVASGDDFASLREVLERRFRRAIEKEEFPDLVVIDGGKGQLGVAREVLERLGVADLDVVGLAKERVERAPRSTRIERKEERVFVPGRRDPIVLPRNSTALFLLQRLRDEAHRFAITYSRKLRHQRRMRSVLDDVPGVGNERRGRLLRHFGSVRELSRASPEAIASVPGIGPSLAREIAEKLRQEIDEKTGRRRLVLKPVERSGE